MLRENQAFTSLLYIPFILILFLPALLFFSPPPAFANGMAIYIDPYTDRFDYATETNQDALINYENGRQKMILSVGFDNESDGDLVWIFPVPADPNSIILDILKSTPELTGEEVGRMAERSLGGIRDAMLATQIYPMMFGGMSGGTKGSFSTLGGGESAYTIWRDGPIPNVVVYEHIEKEGIVSEIITARTARGIQDYLRDKGLNLDTGAIPALDNYIGQEFSFIVSWMGDSYGLYPSQEIDAGLEYYFQYPHNFAPLTRHIDRLKREYPEFNESYRYPMYFLRSTEGAHVMQELVDIIHRNPELLPNNYRANRPRGHAYRGVYVNFPTRQLYFPMILTSVYGSEVVPATIRVIGNVIPKVFRDIRGYVTTEYYVNGYLRSDGEMTDFFHGRRGNVRYTKIFISAPSKLLTDDLWMRRGTPLKARILESIALYPWILGIFILAGCSMVAGILAGLLTLPKLRKDIVKLAMLGLANCLSIIGLIIATILIKTPDMPETESDILDKLATKGYTIRRKGAIALYIICIPLLAWGLLILPTIGVHFADAIPWGLFLYVLPTYGLIRAWDFSKIAPEDKELFRRLSASGYSTWFFNHVSNGKFAFVPVFSISFIIISMIVIGLFESVVG